MKTARRAVITWVRRPKDKPLSELAKVLMDLGEKSLVTAKESQP